MRERNSANVSHVAGQDPKSHHLLPFRLNISRKLDLKAKPNVNTDTDTGKQVPSNDLATMSKALYSKSFLRPPLQHYTPESEVGVGKENKNHGDKSMR